MRTLSTRTTLTSNAPEEGDGRFSLSIGERTVRADRNDELLAAVIGRGYLQEDDPEVLFLMRLEQ